MYALTRSGRVEATNYRTRAHPLRRRAAALREGRASPISIATCSSAKREQAGAAVFLEHAWNMGWCDPCAAEPLSADELRELGAFWLADRSTWRWPWQPGAPQLDLGDTFVTRLHVRYDAQSFPEDLMLQVTGDTDELSGPLRDAASVAGRLAVPGGHELPRASSRAGKPRRRASSPS